ncbi:MAG: hypothetical protein C4562_03525 [Actinobacteria bacterium]|nr:MAG: hypothetical protein C4562_03525 [Actinomycetota bacterium]
MLSERAGSLKIREGSYEGHPLLILDGDCGQDQGEVLQSKISKLVSGGDKTIAIDVRNLHFNGVCCYSIIAKAHREILKLGGNLILIKETQNATSKAHRVRRAHGDHY